MLSRTVGMMAWISCASQSGSFDTHPLAGLKALHYVPRMVGLTFTDPLNPILSRIYQRDLRTIREELGGDTVVLAEPSDELPLDGSWEKFLDECTAQGVAVIPSFSMNNFLELGLSTSEVSNVIQKSFDNFLRYFMLGETTRDWGDALCTAKGPLHPAVKGWIISGLPTLDALVTGAYFTLGGVFSETDASVLTRTRVGVAIRTMSQCVRMMYAEDSLVGLAVSLNNPSAKANTTLFDTSLDTVIQSFEMDDFEGEYFDFWVLETMMHPVTRSVEQVLAALERVDGHSHTKPIIPQLGVSSVIPREGGFDMKYELQQELLLKLHDTAVNLFVGSLIVFQFSDDWAATEDINETSCAKGSDGVMMQSSCGTISGLFHDTTIVAVEFMGLTAHTTWFLHACIEPRWLDLDSGPQYVGLLSQEGNRRHGSFSFEGSASDGRMTMCVMSTYLDVVLNYMHIVLPSAIGDESVPHSIALLALLFILTTCSSWPFANPPSKKLSPADTAPPGVPSFDNGIGDQKYMYQYQRSQRRMDTPTRFSARAMSLADVEIEFSGTAFSGDPVRELDLQKTIMVSYYTSSDVGNCEHAKCVLRSAWAAQRRILEFHVLSEERCQPTSSDDEPTPSDDGAFLKAMKSVHSRALEGYFLWSGVKVENLDPKDMSITNMFINTLLMYVLQVVSEQLLHTPELLNAMYHILRKKKHPQIRRNL